MFYFVLFRSVEFSSVSLSLIWFGLFYFGLLCFGLIEFGILHTKDHGQTKKHTYINGVGYRVAAQLITRLNIPL